MLEYSNIYQLIHLNNKIIDKLKINETFKIKHVNSYSLLCPGEYII